MKSENFYNSSILGQKKVCRKKFHALRGSSNSSEVDLPGAGRRVDSRRSLMLSSRSETVICLLLEPERSMISPSSQS